VSLAVVMVAQYRNIMQDDYRRTFCLAREANRPENALYTLYFMRAPITYIIMIILLLHA